MHRGMTFLIFIMSGKSVSPLKATLSLSSIVLKGRIKSRSLSKLYCDIIKCIFHIFKIADLVPFLYQTSTSSNRACVNQAAITLVFFIFFQTWGKSQEMK